MPFESKLEAGALKDGSIDSLNAVLFHDPDFTQQWHKDERLAFAVRTVQSFEESLEAPRFGIVRTVHYAHLAANRALNIILYCLPNLEEIGYAVMNDAQQACITVTTDELLEWLLPGWTGDWNDDAITVVKQMALAADEHIVIPD